MSEPVFEPAGEKLTAGGMLRAAREKQGLHIAALAAAMKVAPRKLEALENDRHAELLDITFIRALAQTVCRTLKIDARPVLELLPRANTLALEPNRGGLKTPFRDRPGREEPSWSLASVRPLVWAAAALVLGAVAVLVLPNGWWQRGVPSVPAVAAPASAAASTPMVVTGVVAAAALASLAASAPEAAASQPLVETVFSVPQETAASGAAATVASGLVQLRSSEVTWVEVRDARGQLLLSRTVQPGESVGLDGSLPMRLVIGNAAATHLAFRGQPVDLAPRTRDNVARVELQ